MCFDGIKIKWDGIIWEGGRGYGKNVVDEFFSYADCINFSSGG